MSAGFSSRIGAAVASPRSALATSDQSGGQGRAPADLAMLFGLGILALHLSDLATAGWLAVDGEVGIAVQAVVAILARDLSTPLVVLFAAALALSVLAGRRRSLGADLDLACVAFVPALVVHVVAAALVSLAPALSSATLDLVVSALAYLWFAFGLALALRQTRSREVAG